MVLKRQLVFFILLTGFLLSLPFTATAQVEVSDFLEGMTINGDLRIRYDYQDNDDAANDPQDRLRQRFRLGMKWLNPSEKWEIAAGLATGDLEGNSTNDTYSDEEIFETGDIRLDYAYALHKFDNFVFIAGQQKNVFHSTMALWDPDVRPAGFTAQLLLEPFFLTAGYYQVRYIDRDIAEMNAVQAGIESGGLLAAVGFFNVHDSIRIVEERADGDYALNLDPDYEYQIADLLLSYTVETDRFEINPYGHIFYNFGAEGDAGQTALGDLAPTLDPEDENLGWLLGVAAEIDRFGFAVEYAQIAADAAIADIRDSDFGSGLNDTDIKGFKIEAGYKLTKHMEFNTTAFFYEPLERDLDQDVDRYQIDLVYKF